MTYFSGWPEASFPFRLIPQPKTRPVLVERRGTKKLWVKLLPLLITSFISACTLNFPDKQIVETGPVAAKPKLVYTSFALVADSHNENDNLKKALALVKEKEVDYVVESFKEVL